MFGPPGAVSSAIGSHPATLLAISAHEFDQPVFDDEPEIALWRGSLAYAKRDWQQANSEFAKGVAFLRNYPKPLRNRFALDD